MMHLTRRLRFAFAAAALLLPVVVLNAHAQQAGKVPRIGFLDSSTASGGTVLVDAFRQETRKLGWIEGKNIATEYRFAEQKPERLPELAADLVRLKLDLILASGGQGDQMKRGECRVSSDKWMEPEEKT